MKKKTIEIILIGGLFFTGLSCTKLDESDVLYDRVTGDQFNKTELEVGASIGSAYSNLSLIGNSGYYLAITEVTTDETVVPTRGADWGDGGTWVRLKQHKYLSTDNAPQNGWTLCYNGVSICNRLIATLTTINTPVALAYIPELKVLRAIYYYWLLDWYGNVPLSIDYSDTKPPANATRQQVYDFVEKELMTNGPLLKKTGPADPTTYGHVNYYTAYACLAKLYLNAQVYTGTPQWEKALGACNEIINSGKYDLSATYVENFIKDNQNSKEFIWAIPFDRVKFTGFGMPTFTLSYLNQTTYNMSVAPNNGLATTSDFYNTYIDPSQNPGPQGTVVGLDPLGTPTTGTVDKRMTANFLVGPQFSSAGVRLTDAGAEAKDPDGKPFTFTPYINELFPQAWRQSGARVGKWQFYSGMTGSLDNDFAIFRYADILLMKAEAIARIANNWNDAGALAIVNQIRTQHGGVTPYTTMTAATFFAERGREMFCEGWRRQDMIRFGEFNKAYLFHEADADTHVNILPIPNAQINANKNLKQNPGY